MSNLFSQSQLEPEDRSFAISIKIRPKHRGHYVQSASNVIKPEDFPNDYQIEGEVVKVACTQENAVKLGKLLWGFILRRYQFDLNIKVR